MIVKKLKLWLTRDHYWDGPSKQCQIWLCEPKKSRGHKIYEPRDGRLNSHLKTLCIVAGLRLMGLKAKHIPSGTKLEIDVTLRIKGVKP